MLYGLDLFTGIGGNSIALRAYVHTIAYCESDRHAQAVLLSRMADGQLLTAPICDDITKLGGHDFRGKVDIIIAGFPCQDISCAGKGAGLEGERSGLFFEIVRLAKEIEPSYLFLENVPAIRVRGLDRVVEELTALGYDLRWTMLSASDLGAPHKRERWFCLAALADSDSKGLQVGSELSQQELAASERGSSWASEPDVGRVVNGFPLRVDRIKRLGNAVVPAQAKTAFEMLMKGVV